MSNYTLKELRAVTKVFEHLMRDDGLRNKLLGENTEKVCQNIMIESRRQASLVQIDVDKYVAMATKLKG